MIIYKEFLIIYIYILSYPFILYNAVGMIEIDKIIERTFISFFNVFYGFYPLITP
jgi:hypothetical protein